MNELINSMRTEFEKSKSRIKYKKPKMKYKKPSVKYKKPNVKYQSPTRRPLPDVLLESLYLVAEGLNEKGEMRKIIDLCALYIGEEVLDECLALAEKKNNDYAGEEDPFKNFRVCEEIGLCSMSVGILVRLCDKVSRFRNLYEGKEPKVEESMKDTVMDIINYSAIFLASI